MPLAKVSWRPGGLLPLNGQDARDYAAELAVQALRFRAYGAPIVGTVRRLAETEIIVQTGVFSGLASGLQTITYPAPFPTAVLHISVSSDDAGMFVYYIGVNAPTLTYFRMQLTGGGGTVRAGSWMAVGY